jgi:hypothetical protein
MRRTKGEGEMTANVLPTIFTIEIGDTPTLTFEAQNLREAHELWLKRPPLKLTAQGLRPAAFKANRPSNGRRG